MDVNNPDGLTSAEIIFEEVWPSGAGGATRLDTGERVFISKNFVKRSALNPGDCAVAHIVPNDPEHARSGVVWRAVYCTRIGPFDPVKVEDYAGTVTPARVAEVVLDGQVWGAEDVFLELFGEECEAEAAPHEVRRISMILRKLHTDGKLHCISHFPLGRVLESAEFFTTDADAVLNRMLAA